MRGALPYILSVVLLSAALPTRGDTDAFVLREPRDGDRLKYHTDTIQNGRVAEWDEFLNFSSVSATVEDGFGAMHRAYAQEHAICWPNCSTSTYLTDINTGDTVEHTLDFGGSSYGWSFLPGTGLTFLHHRGSSRTDVTEFGPLPNAVAAAAGQVITPGDVLTPRAVPRPGPDVGPAITWTAVGWQTFEGRTLFRLESTVSTREFEASTTSWFDEEHSAPVVSEWSFHADLGAWGTVDGNGITRLVDSTTGTISLLDKSYVPPDPRSVRPGPTAPFGRDGPGEALFEPFPLAEAAAVVRTHEDFSDFFAAHPAAYVAAAEGRFSADQWEWRLLFGEAGGRDALVVSVDKAVTPAGSLPIYFMASTRTQSALVFPTIETVLGRPASCASVEPDFLAALGTEPNGMQMWKYGLLLDGTDLVCLRTQVPPEEARLEGTGLVHEQGSVPSASSYGVDGGRWRLSWSSGEQRTELARVCMTGLSTCLGLV